MKLRIIIIIIAVLANSNVAFSQEGLDSLYGLDPILYNGSLYSTYSKNSLLGDQFLSGADSKKGTVLIGDAVFNNVLINYDIYNQEILLEFGLNKGVTIIKLFKDRVTEFEFDGKTFNIIKDDNSEKYLIYEVIGQGKVQVLYHWYKTLKMSSSVKQNGSHQFSKPFRRMYVRISDKLFKYSNNRTFVSNFDDSIKKELKLYIKSNHINVRKSSQKEINDLVEFCNTQLP